MPASLPSKLSPENRENFRNLYHDIAWFGLLAGSTMAFLNIYAARLGATGFQLGLLSAGPGVINLLFSLPSGRLLEKRPVIPVTFWSSVLQRFGYLVLVPLPALFGPQEQIWSITGLTLLMALPGTLLAIAFNAMFADLTPIERRAEIVGRRNVLYAILVTITTLACGQILDRMPYPYNFQVVFAVGAVGAAMSSYHLSRLRNPGGGPPVRIWKPMGDLAWPGMARMIDGLRNPPGLRFLTRAEGRRLLRPDLLRGPFGRFLGAYFLFYTFQFLPVPLFPLFFVRELDLSNGAISLGTALTHLMMVLGSLRLSYIEARLGSHRRMLILGALLYGQYTLLLAFARDANLFWVASLTGGLIWSILNGGLVNRLMEQVPENDRPAHMALHNMVLNLGVLIGSLMGPALADWLGLREALLASTALRLAAGLLLVYWG